jgi:uncharacterized protein (DUF4415 family)
MLTKYDFSRGKRGPVIRPRGKTRITIYIDDEVLEAFRQRSDQAGLGYQTMMNQALRDHLTQSRPLDEETLRRVLREEVLAAR